MYLNKMTFDPPPISHDVNNSDLVTYCACYSEGESDDTVVNSDCFYYYDPGLLGNIYPDINYLNSNNKMKNTPYDQSFRKKFHSNNYSLSMLHLNIRNIHDHFL